MHVTPYLPPDHWGGIELHVFELCKYLSKEHEVTIITSGKKTEKIKKSNNQQIYKFRSVEVPKIPPLIPQIENPIIPDLNSKILKTGEIDLIHAHGQEYAISYEAIKTAVKEEIPCVLTIHHTGEALAQYATIRLLRKILSKTAFKFSINSADAVIAVSKGAVRYLRNFHPKKQVLIPNGIDLERFKNLKKSSEYVLFVGRLDPLKGPEVFIRAIPLVLRRLDTNFMLVGAGPQKEFLKNLVQKLGLEKHVQFKSNVPYNQLPGIISQASVLVAPYNAGYSMLEAGAAEKPVISARLDWNMETLGDAALYVEPKNVKEIADATVKVLENVELAQKLGRRARDFVEANRDWQILYPKIIEVYKEVMA